MNKLPTDLQIFESIYSEYLTDFHCFVKGEHNNRETRAYVPINFESIAKTLKTDPQLLFGRLYFHLGQKYRYKDENGGVIPLFSIQVSNDRHCVNFPYLAGILAEYRTERRKQLWTVWLSSSALVISIATFLSKWAHL